MNDSRFSAFRNLEKSGWEQSVAGYDEAFARLTSQSICPLLDGLGVSAGTRHLDIASGPGYVAAQAAERGARVVGVDFSSAMVALARQRLPQVEFREGDAEALDLPDASFDTVSMNYGLLHLDHPERALAEVARVLVPGGAFGFTVWAPPTQTAAFRIVLGSVEKHGRMDVALPAGPPFFQYSDAEVTTQALHTAGLVDVRITTVPQVWRFSRAEELFESMLVGTVRTAALLRAQTPDALDRIGTAVAAEVRTFAANGAFELPMPSVLALARKPR